MFRRVLVASDLSAQSNVALRVARGLAQSFGARLMVAHVVDMPPEIKRWAGTELGDDRRAYDALLARQTQAAAVALDRQITTLGLAGVRGVQAIVRAGAPAPTLAALVEEVDADLVLVARGRGGALGPVAERLVRLVGRTVMVTPVRGKGAATLGIPDGLVRGRRRRAAA